MNFGVCTFDQKMIKGNGIKCVCCLLDFFPLFLVSFSLFHYTYRTYRAKHTKIWCNARWKNNKIYTVAKKMLRNTIIKREHMCLSECDKIMPGSVLLLFSLFFLFRICHARTSHPFLFLSIHYSMTDVPFQIFFCKIKRNKESCHFGKNCQL